MQSPHAPAPMAHAGNVGPEWIVWQHAGGHPHAGPPGGPPPGAWLMCPAAAAVVGAASDAVRVAVHGPLAAAVSAAAGGGGGGDALFVSHAAPGSLSVHIGAAAALRRLSAASTGGSPRGAPHDLVAHAPVSYSATASIEASTRPVNGALSRGMPLVNGREVVFASDIGGVIIAKASRDHDTSFFADNYLNTPEEKYAVDALARIVRTLTPQRVFLISKCKIKTQRKTLNWLEHHRVFERTGLLPENVHFCETRPEKLPICRNLGVNVFVDDTEEVVQQLSADDALQHVFWFHGRRCKLANASTTRHWEDLMDQLARMTGGAW